MSDEDLNDSGFDAGAYQETLTEEIVSIFSRSRLPLKRIQQLAAFGACLAETSQTLNLTRILEPRDMVIRHFLDSCQLLNVLKKVSGPICDVGTGGGIPGIPLAIFRRDLNVGMIDGRAKKIRFIEDCIQGLKLKNAFACAERAEDHLKKNKYHALLSRAALKPAAMMELLVTTGPAADKVIFMEGVKGKENIKKTQGIARKAGYVFDLAFPYRLPGLDNERFLICYKRR